MVAVTVVFATYEIHSQYKCYQQAFIRKGEEFVYKILPMLQRTKQISE